MSEITRILAALAAAPQSSAALATLVQVEGSSYRRPGARLLLLEDRRRVGSISGGCLEQDVLERAERVLRTGRSELAVYDTTEENDLVWGVGMGCQGVVKIFLERIPSERTEWLRVLEANQQQRRDTAIEVDYTANLRGTQLAQKAASANATKIFRETIPATPALLICGAGDDARPLLRMARELGWTVTIADARSAYATTERFPEADRVITGALDKITQELSLDARTFAVVMTHRYEDDCVFMRALLAADLRYVGQLGPRKRTERILAKIAAEGFALESSKLARLHAPVGLDLGGSSPETVALAILAEMQARLSGRTAGYLRDRVGPIHD